MQLMLTLAAAAMLARMALLSRIDHFGFFQGALAGMLAAAFLIGETARRPNATTGTVGGFVILIYCCGFIAARSNSIHAEQTQSVSGGADQFYVFNKEVDPTGALVDWTVKELKSIPRQATVLVVPDGWLAEVSEGLSINFLSRHISPIPDVLLGSSEELLVERLKKASPDYIVEISRPLPSGTVQAYGLPGQPGWLALTWIHQNYTAQAAWGEPFLRHKCQRRPGSFAANRENKKTRSMQPITERVLSPQTTMTL